ncbi:MAG: hypothetical protein J3K34DRAFT_411263 [Monoraphidium minutum]|nr:MAG: hypothetical protein J3K34DRAFT_411263 [Monoraphidium minutum]
MKQRVTVPPRGALLALVLAAAAALLQPAAAVDPVVIAGWSFVGGAPSSTTPIAFGSEYVPLVRCDLLKGLLKGRRCLRQPANQCIRQSRHVADGWGGAAQTHAAVPPAAAGTTHSSLSRRPLQAPPLFASCPTHGGRRPPLVCERGAVQGTRLMRLPAAAAAGSPACHNANPPRAPPARRALQANKFPNNDNGVANYGNLVTGSKIFGNHTDATTEWFSFNGLNPSDPSALASNHCEQRRIRRAHLAPPTHAPPACGRAGARMGGRGGPQAHSFKLWKQVASPAFPGSDLGFVGPFSSARPSAPQRHGTHAGPPCEAHNHLLEQQLPSLPARACVVKGDDACPQLSFVHETHAPCSHRTSGDTGDYWEIQASTVGETPPRLPPQAVPWTMQIRLSLRRPSK